MSWRTVSMAGLYAVILVGGAVVTDVHAAPTFPRPGMHRSGSGPDQQIVTELRNIRHLLEKADHDYKGHRAKAVEEIGGAIHALEHGKGAKGKNEKGAAGKGSKEPQAESDKQLREALKGLEGVHRQLERGQGEHHKHAAMLVHKAIEQLRVALKVA
jgi:hypothetical protein